MLLGAPNTKGYLREERGKPVVSELFSQGVKSPNWNSPMPACQAIAMKAFHAN